MLETKACSEPCNRYGAPDTLALRFLHKSRPQPQQASVGQETRLLPDRQPRDREKDHYSDGNTELERRVRDESVASGADAAKDAEDTAKVVEETEPPPIKTQASVARSVWWRLMDKSIWFAISLCIIVP